MCNLISDLHCSHFYLHIRVHTLLEQFFSCQEKSKVKFFNFTGKQIWVDWDANGHTNVYHYGAGRYDVLLVDEPRIVGSDGDIKVGCVVQPGTSSS